MAALDFMRFQIFDSESYVGIPVILGSRLGKLSTKDYGYGTEDTLMVMV